MIESKIAYMKQVSLSWKPQNCDNCVKGTHGATSLGTQSTTYAVES